MSNKRELKAELEMPLADLAQYLQEIVAGLRAGQIYLEHGGQVVGLRPGAVVSVEINAKQKKDKEKLCLEMAWRRTEEPAPSEPDLVISSATARTDDPDGQP